MKQFTLYHNPICSKSRHALQILQSLPINLVVIDYMQTPLNLEKIKQLGCYFDVKEFVRHNEPIFKALKLSLDDKKNVLEALVEEPILMQRPIVVYKNTAIIARPPEKIITFFSESDSFEQFS